MTKTENKRQPPPKTVLFVESVPGDLKRKFKALCARKGVSMSAAMVALIRRAVAANLIENS